MRIRIFLRDVRATVECSLCSLTDSCLRFDGFGLCREYMEMADVFENFVMIVNIPWLLLCTFHASSLLACPF